MLKSIISFVVIMTVIIGIPALAGTIEHEYTLQGSVVAIENNTVVVVEDLQGNIWTFEKNGFAIGDDVLMLMYDHATPNNIYDDVIKNVGKIHFMG